MQIEWIYALIGGAIIGLSTTIMLYFNGKITGISGILGSALSTPKKDHFWRYSFLIGLVLGSFLVALINPSLFTYTVKMKTHHAIAGGLLVGLGTRIGSGCTSGHGVCGLARLSVRSLVATLTFMGFGILTVTLMNM